MCLCLYVWNTFDTRGVCPACGREWSQTQCPRCKAWSRHEDWYTEEPEPMG
jgi:predicted amidophosphoribosyltransferase